MIGSCSAHITNDASTLGLSSIFYPILWKQNALFFKSSFILKLSTKQEVEVVPLFSHFVQIQSSTAIFPSLSWALLFNATRKQGNDKHMDQSKMNHSNCGKEDNICYFQQFWLTFDKLPGPAYVSCWCQLKWIKDSWVVTAQSESSVTPICSSKSKT